MEFEKLYSAASNLFSRMREDRRTIHSSAEAGMRLERTQGYCLERLQKMGYAPKVFPTGGITCTIGEGEECTLLRADMDALPFFEDSGEVFSSKTGAMHACGHDIHAACLLGAAQLLYDRRAHLKRRVKLCFQAGEETLEGALSMIEGGLLSSPEVTDAMMLHVIAATDIECGTLIIPPAGIGASGADFFTVIVRGRGCHGATPHLGADPIRSAAAIISALECIIPKELPTGGGDVLTIGRISAGEADNMIPSACTFGGTLRSYEDGRREYIKARLSEIAGGIARAYRTEAEVIFTSGCPSFLNDEKLTAALPALFKGASPAPLVLPEGSRGGGSEDFAYVSRRVPSVMVALAAGEKSRGYEYPLHSPKVRFDEAALPYGAAAYAAFALR